MARTYDKTLLPQVIDDIRGLGTFDDTLIDIALQAINDLAEHRKIGKLLGSRHVSGDLSGCRRLRFDLPGQRPQGFRIVYRHQPDDTAPITVEVVAIGPRGGHAAYQAAVARLTGR